MERGCAVSEIWDAVRRGEPLTDELIIDCHAHMGPHAQIDCSRGKGSAEDMIQWMDQCGVSMVICCPIQSCWHSAPAGNDEIARVVDEHPDRFVGYTGVNPRYGEAEVVGELEKHLLQGNHKGIKIHPANNDYRADGPDYRPMWEFANEHELPVLSHTWAGESQDEPAMFVPIAKEFPRVKVILGHSREPALEAAKQADNIYLDLCLSVMPDGLIELMVNELGADRVLFGTDVSFFDGRAKIGQVAAARISDDDKRKIFGLNAERIFSIRRDVT